MWSKIISLILGIVIGLVVVFGYQKYTESKQVVDTGIDFSQIEGKGGDKNSFPGTSLGNVNQEGIEQLNNEEESISSEDINN